MAGGPFGGWRSHPRRPLVVVVVDVRFEHALEVTFADDEESVEALGSDRADESFGVRVGLRGGATVCG